MSAKKPKIQKIEAPKTNNRVEQLRYLAALRGEVEQEAPKLNVKRFLIVSAIIVAILAGGIIYTTVEYNRIAEYNERIYAMNVEKARDAEEALADDSVNSWKVKAIDAYMAGPEAAEPTEEEGTAGGGGGAPEEEAAAEAPAAEAAPLTETASRTDAAAPAETGWQVQPWQIVRLVALFLLVGLVIAGYIILSGKHANRKKSLLAAIAAGIAVLLFLVIFSGIMADRTEAAQTARSAAVETEAAGTEGTGTEETGTEQAADGGTTTTAAASGEPTIDESQSTYALVRAILIALLIAYAFFMLVKLLHPKRRRPNRSFWGDLGIYLLMAVFAVAMVFPLVFSIASSLKPLDELFRFPPRVFAEHVTLDNYADLFVTMGQSYVPFSRYLTNTVLITFIGTFGHVVIASMAAFVLAKYDFPGGRMFFSIVVTALMFSGYVTGIPNYVIMSRLGMIDTYWAIILPAFAAPIGLFLMKQFMEGLPTALIEAAHLDGAGEFRIFWSIVMPNVKPAWLTIIIFSVQSLWNTNAATVIYTEKNKTLVYALQQIQAGGIARTGQAAAVTVIVMLVPILIFILSQSRILETMASSGLKD